MASIVFIVNYIRLIVFSLFYSYMQKSSQFETFCDWGVRADFVSSVDSASIEETIAFKDLEYLMRIFRSFKVINLEIAR